MIVSFPPPPGGPIGAYIGRVLDTLRKVLLRVVSADAPAPRVILQSPNGSNYTITAADNGALTVTSAASQAAGTLNTTGQAVMPFTADTFKLVDPTDKTKAAQFGLSGVSPSTTRTLTVPDASGTIALTSDIPVVPATFASIKITKFNSSGTFTPDAKCIAGYAVAKGGGGGGGGAAVAPANSHGAAGGGEGNTCIKFFQAADVSPSAAVTVGAGGSGGTGSPGTGGVGGTSSLGTILAALGGGAASQFNSGSAQTGAGNIGDIVLYGATGGQGMQGAVSAGAIAAPGNGGGAGGGVGLMDGTSGTFNTGNPGLANSGGGGAGGSSFGAGPGNISGGAGGSGFVYVVEYLSA